MDGRQLLIYLSIIYKGDWKQIDSAIRGRQYVSDEEAKRVCKRNKSPVVTIVDQNYPPLLRETPAPPFVLYYRGDLSLVSDGNQCVTVVGSRNTGTYPAERTASICSALAKDGITIVSGLAKGIDGIAGRAALEHGRAVAVLGNGLDYHYPAENADLQDEIGKRGLLLSEYPDGTPPCLNSFPKRNRILAGLSCATLIMDAKRQSGTMITAGFASSYNRDVGALPTLAGEDSACNELIKQGAMLVESADDVYLMMKEDATMRAKL